MSPAQVEGPRRLAAVRRRLRTAGLDALIVSDPVGIHYLTGFPRDAFAVAVLGGIASTIERHLREQHGVDGLAFETVVAAGAHGAIPHHTATETPIAQGELLVVDVGIVIDGYRSDMTRTFATGPLDSDAVEVYELVHRAQQAALDMVATGVAAEAVHETAAAVIAAGGHGERFLHGLGHGIGLELHEPPDCEPGAADPLMAGQVLTIEPGVYVPGRFGTRIEDEVVLTDSGYEPLTFFASDLLTCG